MDDNDSNDNKRIEILLNIFNQNLEQSRHIENLRAYYAIFFATLTVGILAFMEKIGYPFFKFLAL